MIKKPEKPDFLYYGSSKKSALLIPSETFEGDKKAGRQNVISATSNRNIALAYALGAIPDETGTYDRVMSYKPDVGVTMLFLKGHPDFGGKGYVYKLSPKGFRYTGGTQWINTNPVTPLDVTEINVDDYLYMFRFATEEEKRQIEENFTEIE